MVNPPFTLGVNYWPRRKAMFWWSNFDSREIREEFSLIADLGMSMVRIFLLWEDWQPTPDSVNQDALNNLEIVCDIAQNLDLSLNVTFFTGHMSGPSWAPGWMLLPNQTMPAHIRQVVSDGKIVDCAYRNQYSDSMLLNASDLMVETVVARFKDHPAVGVWNLGNEPDLFALPDNAAQGKSWTRHLTSLIKSIDPATPVTCGLHVNSLFEDNGLRISDVFAEVDFPVMHGYPMYVDWARGPLDAWYVPFLCALTSALSGGKPTLMEELGGCTEAPGKPSSVWAWTEYGKPRTQFMAAEGEFADYVEQLLHNLPQVGASGAVFWCFADYHPDLWDRPPCLEAWHERFFGLMRPDGSLKPHAEVIKRFATSRPTVQPPRYSIDLDITPDQYYHDPLKYVQRFYAEFLSQVGQPFPVPAV
ncbi:MAG: glycoside hydrolase family 2 TIM barrel-domain containing protein [Chloroflexota bacterium]|nr:glycoside hydrolase family 2 TIM barrel-domain containing protein [Chloroflexota bacterium]